MRGCLTCGREIYYIEDEDGAPLPQDQQFGCIDCELHEGSCTCKKVSRHIVTVTLDDGNTSSHTEPTEKDCIACADLIFPCDGVIAVEVKEIDTQEIIYRLPKKD